MNQHTIDLKRRQKKTRKDPAMYLFILYVGILILFFNIAPKIVVPLIFGWYLSLIIEYLARKLSKLPFISFKIASIISAIIFFLLLFFLIYQIFPILFEEGGRLFEYIKEIPENFNLEQIKLFSSSALPFLDNFNIDISESLNQITSNLASSISTLGVSILNYLVSNISGAFTSITLFVITAAYFTNLAPLIRKNLWRFLPKSSRPKSIAFLSRIYNHFRIFIGGQIVIAACVGLIVGLGMFIAGIPYALFLGFLVGITNFIPYLGVILSAVPALLLGFTHGGLWGIGKVLIVLLLANQIEAWVLSPKIQGSIMKLNWFAILLTIFLCGSIFGLAGILLAIPILVFIRDFWIFYVQDAMRKI